ncbi:hypothetical protein [Actinoplanes utahensis]|uniref:Uncharacterized protein n=1 Tax=Actinoplanes utahensis TaxID=1869 RepID=A0A0A6XAV5_ACTUT|nr:hypothetical protein [Actinoplanes utahensis]KHD77222.1 hypothetical protein MB27_12330 [Actinoplanes utahensis]GIF33557.1 hypothetical protein Aut01nite_65430 [Actinoplanes utahensis]
MNDRKPAAVLLLRRRRISLVCGCLCSALAASIMAVPLPYHAIVAAAALGIVFAVWIILLSHRR